MQIRVSSHREPEPLDLSAFERLASFVLVEEEVIDSAELSLALIDLDEMSALNERYRGIAAPTDVLAFGCDDPCPVAGDEPVTLGDVLIAPQVAEVNARELGHTIEHELNVLTIHGILHLLGYDHEDDASAEVMQSRESELLSSYSRLQDW